MIHNYGKCCGGFQDARPIASRHTHDVDPDMRLNIHPKESRLRSMGGFAYRPISGRPDPITVETFAGAARPALRG